jgi:uncharacterized protein involved in exopolysaccharide biosynthesis
MTDLVNVNLPANNSSTDNKFPWLPYIIAWALINGIIWLAAFLYIRSLSPVYTSEWALILPGEESVNVNVEGVGQTSQSPDSAKYIKNLDPRNNILYIANSQSVLSTAANKLAMSLEEFGNPTINLIKQSTIMEFKIDGKTPEQAQSKALAIHQAILKKINLLRHNKSQLQIKMIQTKINLSENKLAEAQKRLNQQKTDSSLIANEQVTTIANNLEQLRINQLETLQEIQKSNTRIQEISTKLGISPQQTKDALILQADELFQKYLTQYNDATANLVILLSKWKPKSPWVTEEQARQQDARLAFLERGSYLLNKPVDQQILEYLILQNSTGDTNKEILVRELINQETNQQELRTQFQTLNQQIEAEEYRLKLLAKEQIPLDNLQRDLELAEAVWVATVAELDLGKNDSSAAYPIVQLLSEPSLPEMASGPDKKITWLAAVAASFITTTGIILLWWEKQIFSQPNPRNNSPS